MELKRLDTALSIKAVDTTQRLIEGYAAVAGNKDRQGDIIESTAFDRTLKENDDVLVFIGHDASRLPVGEPSVIRADTKGLLTQTRVYNTVAGDELLEVAKQRMQSGRTLGMSIGFRTRKDRYTAGARHLVDVDLLEYSFLASPTLAANPEATMTGVKSDEPTSTPEPQRSVSVKDLPDSAFAFIETGGTLDEEQKTVPRAARHFAHHAPDGSLDTDLLTAALHEAEHDEHGAKALAHLKRHAVKAGLPLWPNDGQDDAHSPQWSQGAAPTLLVIASKMAVLAESIATDRLAMERLGLDTKGGERIPVAARAQLKAMHDSIGQILDWADSIERGEDGKQRVDLFRHRLALLQLEEVS